jgi:hypothetical protein
MATFTANIDHLPHVPCERAQLIEKTREFEDIGADDCLGMPEADGGKPTSACSSSI